MQQKLNFILKSIDEEYLSNYLNKGEIYFNPAEYFSIIENNEANMGKFDNDEGVWVEDVDLKEKSFFIGKAGSKEALVPLKNLTSVVARTSSKEISTTPIACFTQIKPEDFTFHSDGYYTLKSRVIEGLEEISGGRKFVLTYQDYFNTRIEALESKEHFGLCRGPIIYYEKSTKECEDKVPFGLHEKMVLFTKKKRYEAQKEYRIALLNRTTETGFAIHIGSIEDMSYVGNSLLELSEIRIKPVMIEEGQERFISEDQLDIQ